MYESFYECRLVIEVILKYLFYDVLFILVMHFLYVLYQRKTSLYEKSGNFINFLDGYLKSIGWDYIVGLGLYTLLYIITVVLIQNPISSITLYLLEVITVIYIIVKLFKIREEYRESCLILDINYLTSTKYEDYFIKNGNELRCMKAIYMLEGSLKSLELKLDFSKKLIPTTGLLGFLGYIFSEPQKVGIILVCISIIVLCVFLNFSLCKKYDNLNKKLALYRGALYEITHREYGEEFQNQRERYVKQETSKHISKFYMKHSSD